MARSPRKLVVDADNVGVYHCIQRCVRRAFLCGTDAELIVSVFDHQIAARQSSRQSQQLSRLQNLHTPSAAPSLFAPLTTALLSRILQQPLPKTGKRRRTELINHHDERSEVESG